MLNSGSLLYICISLILKLIEHKSFLYKYAGDVNGANQFLSPISLILEFQSKRKGKRKRRERRG